MLLKSRSIIFGKHLRVAFKSGGADIVPITVIYVFLDSHKELLTAAGMYVIEKVADLVADVLRDWARSPRKENRRIMISLVEPVDYLIQLSWRYRRSSFGSFA
jgi:hypothetical protein